MAIFKDHFCIPFFFICSIWSNSSTSGNLFFESNDMKIKISRYPLQLYLETSKCTIIQELLKNKFCVTIYKELKKIYNHMDYFIMLRQKVWYKVIYMEYNHLS